jgi:hypothetical protein
VWAAPGIAAVGGGGGSPPRHVSKPVAKLGAQQRSSNEWVTAHVLPSPSDASSNVNRSVPT